MSASKSQVNEILVPICVIEQMHLLVHCCVLTIAAAIPHHIDG